MSRQEARGGMVLGAVGALAVLLAAAPGQAQIVGQNVNMVSGTQWPGGDPFLQRQNEPSLAVSSRNPLHLLAGANDYRTVDVPGLPDGKLSGDAWLGVFKSFDGGQTWQSTLLPGYPQDQSAQGLASPLKGFSAGGDPVMRPGTNGLFYFSGIAFNRDTDLGAVFVTSLIDLNNKENGDATQGLDTIKYVGTKVVDTGTSGQFLDKPWVAADVPRAGAGQCTINVSPTQSFPAGTVYFTWAKFTGSTSTKIMFTRSLDCGATWSNPIKLSESSSINQGTAIAIDPLSGAVHVTWRRFATSSQSDAIVFAKSTDFGKTFTKATDVATIIPFDQGTTATSFRTESLPTIAASVDSGNTSRVHLAWAARPSAGADARIYLTTSLNGTSWSNPVSVDTGPVVDDYGATFTRGHQFMPQLAFAAGQLMLLYYDTRLDHTLGLFYPNSPFQPDSFGRFYKEQRLPRGELLTSPSQVYTPYVDDFGLAQQRHTLDVRVAQAAASSSPAFTTARVSQYKFGTRGDETGTIQYLQQLQVNPPNLPLFKQGTVAFIGDYIDIAGQTFLPPAAGGSWTYNVAPSRAPVFYATWTSNQDVRPPRDGNWQNYTPVGGGGTSIFDPTQTTSPCVTGQEGMRNQNIYSARITQGLQVTSPQTSKPLSTTLTRAFVVLVRNATKFDKDFVMTIASQPIGGKAAFLLHPQPTDPDPLTALDVTIPAHSGIARSVFATSSNPAASITVNVEESDSLGNPVPGGLSNFVTLNPDGTVPSLANPDGVTGPGTDINTIEIYNPDVSNPDVSNSNVSNPDVSNPDVSNPDVSNPDVSNPDVSNPDISNPDVSNPDVSNSNVANPDVSNPDISNQNITDLSITDATYKVTNVGNTSASYHVKLVGNAPANAHLQLIISKAYQNPISINCQLLQEQRNEVLVNINDPVFEDTSNLTDPNVTDPRTSNATFYLRPGETVLVTLRGIVDPATMRQITQQVAPVTIPHAGQTYAAPLFISISALPDATYGGAYSQALQVIGGTAPYAWGVASGSLPGGLSLSPSGQITGAPSTVGTSSFTVQVTDADGSAAARDLTLTVNQGGTTTSVSSSANPSVFGQVVVFTATVSAVGPASGTPTGTVTFKVGSTTLGTATLAGGSAPFTTSALSVGTHSITATYGGDSNFVTGTSSALSQVVSKASTSTLLTSSGNPSIAGQSVTFTATVSAVSPGSGTPTGTVTFKDGSTTLGTATLASGKAAFTTSALSAGSHSITASYAGDSNFFPSASSTLTQNVSSGYTFIGFQTPLTTAGTYSSPTYSGSFTLTRGVPIKWQLKDANGHYINDLSTTQSLQAVLNVGCPGTPGAQTILLYSPTAGAKGGSTFRSGSNQFIFNWDTSSGTAPGCYTLVLQLADGSAPKATIVKLK